MFRPPRPIFPRVLKKLRTTHHVIKMMQFHQL